jgi:uncharacterized protein with HEPN domain
MPSGRPELRFLDIVENIDVFFEFIKDMEFDRSLSDGRTRLAVEQCLLIISEVARKLGSEAEGRCSENSMASIACPGKLVAARL